MTKQEFATLVVAMQAMYGEDFIGTEQALDVWYALLHDLDYQILSKALQQYMLTNKFKPTVAELREIYAEWLVQCFLIGAKAGRKSAGQSGITECIRRKLQWKRCQKQMRRYEKMDSMP